MKLKNLAVMLLCSAALPAFAADIEIDGGTSVTNNNTSVSADNLRVGIDYSSNSLIITNNATVTVDNAYIGSDSSDENSVIITGTNSYLQASSTLNVVEKGTLNVTNGGWVYVGSMDTNAPAGGGIRVGDTNGTASLSVESGTQITAENLLVGVQSDETGSVTLSGAETTFTLSNNLQLGTAGSNNTITVDGGATLSIGEALQVGSTNGGNNHLYINDGGSVAILGATTITDGTTNSINVASGGTLSLSEGLDLDDTSNGFNINSGAALQLGGTLLAESLDQNIAVTLDGTNASWTTADHMYIGNVSNANSLVVQNGAAITNAIGKKLYVGSNSDDNHLTIGTNSQLLAQGEAFVGSAGSKNTLTIENSGKADIAGSLTIGGNNAASTQNKVYVQNDGQLTVQSDIIVGVKGDKNELNIDNGTLTAQHDLILGQEDGANGNSLNISGSNTSVSVANDLILGKQGSNNRYLQTGGTNTVAGSFIIGETEDATGNVATVGEDALLDIHQNLTVGKEGGGSILNIRDGGTVNVAGDAVIGDEAGNNYIFLEPDNPDSRFNVSGDLVVGIKGGDSRFAVYGGTADIDGSLYLGASTNQHEEEDDNYIHLQTTNAVLNVANAIHIGASNSVNTARLASGAKARAQDLFVGAYEGTSNNVVTVSGHKYDRDLGWLEYVTDSLLSVSNDLTIGSATGSNNTVNVDNGGILYVGGNIDIGAETNDLNNSLNVNSGGTLQSLDWDFADISSNIFLNSGSTLEIGGLLTGTNQVDGGIEFALNSGLSTNNAIWNSGSNTLYVGRETSDNILSVFGQGSVISGDDLIIGFGTNSHNNAVAIYGSNSTLTVATDLVVGNSGNNNSLTITNAGSVTAENLTIGSGTNSDNNVVGVYGSNSTLNVGNDLIVGNFGSDNSLIITNGATVNVSSNAWVGKESDDNWITVEGTNSSLTIGNNMLVGSTDVTSSRYWLEAFDTANIFVGGNLTMASGLLDIDYNSQVKVSGNYEQDNLAYLQVSVSTNSATTNLVVGGTANFKGETTIIVKNDGTIPNQLVDEDGNTNKVGRTIVAAGDLQIADEEATTALLHSAINFQTNGLFGFDYFVIDDTIYLDNFSERSIAEAGGLDGMLADVANEIEGMADASNELAQAMIDTFEEMSGEEIGKAMDNYYGEKGSSIPINNVINQGIGGLASELTLRGDNTRERMGAASAAINWNKPAGTAGPHMEEQELQGWVSGYGSWGTKDSDDGYGEYDSDLSGFIIGADLTVSENLLIGIAGGANSGSLDGDNGKDADSDTTYGAIYASLGTKDWFFDGSVIYGSSSVDQHQGNLFNTKASYDSQNLAFYLGGGKEILGEYFIFTPQASVLINYYDQDDYNEKSTDAVARSVDGFDDVYIQSSIGCNVGFYMGMGDITLKPELRAHWLHEFNADDQSLDYGLIGGVGSPYTMKLQAPEEDILRLGAGISAKVSEYLELRADIDTQQADGYSDVTMFGSLRYQF